MKTANDPSLSVASLRNMAGMSATMAERVGTLRLRMRNTSATTIATTARMTISALKTSVE